MNRRGTVSTLGTFAALATVLVTAPTAGTTTAETSPDEMTVPAASAPGARIVAGPVHPVRPLSRRSIDRLALVAGPEGPATAVWDAGDYVTAARNRRDGTWRGPVDLGYGELPDAAVDGRGRVTVVWRRRSAADLATRRWAGGRWGPVVHLTEPRDIESHVWPFRLGVNGRGDTVAVWNRKYGEYDTDTWDRVEAVFRSADGTWGPVSVLRRQYGYTHAALVDGRGAATVVYSRVGLTVQRRSPGQGWRPAVDLGIPGSFGGAAGNSEGRLVLSVLDRPDVLAHEKPPGQPWLPGVTVGEVRGIAQQAPVVLDRRGRAAIGFAAVDGSASVVRRTPDQPWTLPTAVSPAGVDARVIRLVRGAEGRLGLTWVAGPEDRPRLWTAVSEGGGDTWSMPVALTGPRTRAIPLVAAAFEPDGDLVVVWGADLAGDRAVHLLSRTVS